MTFKRKLGIFIYLRMGTVEFGDASGELDKINILIVDDEFRARENIRMMLSEFVGRGVNVLAAAANTKEAEVLIKNLSPDAVFLDIQMPTENAFHFLDRIGPLTFEVVFVTAYDQYAVRAFRLNAIDYILKPINIADLQSTINKLKERKKYNSVYNNPFFNEFSKNFLNTNTNQITLKGIETLEKIQIPQIIFLEANNSYSKFIFEKNDSIKELIVSYPLADYEETLPTNLFYRVHRSYLVNCKFVNSVRQNKDSYIVKLKGGFTVPVSRRRFAHFCEFLKEGEFGYG